MGFDLGLVDPELGRHQRGVRSVAEPFGVGVVGGGRVFWRSWSMATAVPKWTEAGVCQAIPECRWM